MSRHVYFNILDDQVLPFSQHLHDEYALVTLFFKMTTAQFIGLEEYVTGFMNTHTQHVDWPAKSTDLNPIENLCDMLKQRVKRRNQHSRNLVDLRNQILSEGLKLYATYRQNLLDSLPN
ncbi:hypothetical protein AVEN_73300-1 [Araneus ventricosus]|uniref:Tc1-like transposase DDE domain-containing protein n=1 Tax=Araneus ventricosus TaxID=182803 RepID=A0A4Y2VBJ3_ARAVE|nr:hypothetical protein AVEN_73300-1 [Araneus ventricosus]